MTTRIGSGLLLTLAILSAPVAQAQTEAPAPTTGPTDGVVLSEGTPVAPAATNTDRQNGEAYVQEVIKDWELRCVYLSDSEDPCQMYQLLNDEAGNPTAEVTLFPVTDERFQAGARVVTPLETALLAGVTFQVDAGLPNQYPFQVCNPAGCIAQIGLTSQQVESMKAGTTAKLTIVPFRAQNTQVNLNMSLTGFTQAFTRLQELQTDGQ